MQQVIITKKCRICGSSYTMTFNERSKDSKYQLKYYNSDGKNGYYSNKSHNICPTCAIDKKGRTNNEY